MACCKSCAKGHSRAKVAGMKKSTSKLINNGLAVAGGILVGGMVSRLPMIQANPILRIAAPLGGALLAKKFLGSSGDAVAAGMISLSVTQAVSTYAPNIANTVGLSGGVPFKSTYLPGVAGIGAAREKVQVVMQ